MTPPRRGLLLLLAAAVSLSACSAYVPPAQHRSGGKFSVAVDDFPVSLNPLVAGDVSSVRAYTPLFPHLFGLDAQLRPVPDLALSAEPSNGGKVWTVSLRSAAQWSDGVAMGSDDVVFTVETERNPRLDTRAHFDWAELASIKTIGPAAVQFELTRPDAAFPATHLLFPIVPKHILTGAAPEKMSRSIFGTQPSVSGGPFRYVGQREGHALYYVRNQHYYGRRPAVDEVGIFVTADPLSAPSVLSQGYVLWFPGMTRRAADEAQGVAAIKVVSYPDLGYDALTFNTRPGHLFGDVALRRALSAAVDRSALARAATSSHGVPMWGLVNSASWAYQPSAAPVQPRDTAATAALLTASGWGRAATGVTQKGGIELRAPLYYPSDDPDRDAGARALATQAREAGISLTPTALPPASFEARISAGDFEVALTANGQSPDPDQSAYLHSRTPDGDGTLNFGGFTDPQMDALLESERGLTGGGGDDSRSKRRDIFASVDQRLRDQVPVVPLWAVLHYTGFNETVQFAEPPGNQLDQGRGSAFYAALYLSA